MLDQAFFWTLVVGLLIKYAALPPKRNLKKVKAR